MSQQPTTRIDTHFIAAGKYHDIDYPQLEIPKLLAEHPHIRATVAADYSGLERLDQCRFLITYTCDLMPAFDQAAQLRTLMEKGGRWMTVLILLIRDNDKGRIDCKALGQCRGHYEVPGMADFYLHNEMCACNYDVHYDPLRRTIHLAMRDGD